MALLHSPQPKCLNMSSFTLRGHPYELSFAFLNPLGFILLMDAQNRDRAQMLRHGSKLRQLDAEVRSGSGGGAWQATLTAAHGACCLYNK